MRFTNALLETHARAFWYSVSQLNFDEINIIYNKHIHFIHIYLYTRAYTWSTNFRFRRSFGINYVQCFLIILFCYRINNGEERNE